MSQKKYVNLGSGKRILPTDPDPSDWLIDPAIFHYPLWYNVDKVALPGVDECVDLFTYPWPWPDNHFDGTLLSHIVEHIPHEIRLPYEVSISRYDAPIRRRWNELSQLQDGWFAFFSELTRVLTPGAIAHIISPYAWSQGAATDPTHTRLITEHVWTHQLAKADVNDQFAYSTGNCNLEMVEPPKLWITPMFYHLLPDPSQPYIQQGGHNWTDRIVYALQTQLNVCYAIYVKLRAVK